MNIPKKLMFAVGALALTQLAGCYVLSVPLYTSLCAPGADAQVKKLEKKQEYLLKKYENKTKATKTSIAKQKREINRSLKTKDVGKMIGQIDSLYKYTHPCGKDECDEDAKKKPYGYGRDYIIEHEDIDREEDFIESSMDKSFKLAQTLAREGKFGQLELALKQLDSRYKYDGGRRKKFLNYRANLKTTWIRNLVKQAKSQEKTLPGTALLNYFKAASLAKENGKTKQANELQNVAVRFQRRLVSEYTYNIYIGAASGPISNGAVAKLKKMRWSDRKIRLSNSKNGSTRATLGVNSARPSFTISQKSATDSFQYTSGTKQVENPNYAKYKRDLQVVQGNHGRCADACNSSNKYCTWKYWKGGGSKRIENSGACAAASNARQHLATIRAQMQAEGASKTVPRRVPFRYDYTLHIHAGRANVAYKLSPTDSGRPITKRYTQDGRLTDREHPAYRKGDGRVRADAKQVPAQRAVWSTLESNYADAIAKDIGIGHKDYLNRLLSQGGTQSSQEKAKRINGMVLYYLVGPSRLPKNFKKDLSSLSGVPKATSYIKK